MQFIRLEHGKDQTMGPYNSSLIPSALVRLMERETGFNFHSHPVPCDDGLNGVDYWDSNWYFGFKDWKSCIWWWYRGESGLRVAELYGFVFSVYEVHEREDGRHQSCARIEGMKPIRTVKPMDLMKENQYV